MFNLFKQKKDSNLERIMVDMHSHLIPGIDDGVKTIEESVESIRLLHSLGYQHLYTTPHIMSDYYNNTPEIILVGLNTVRNAVKEAKIPITIDAAAEYYVDYQFYSSFDASRILTINNKFILFELSFLNAPDIIWEIIFKMQSDGFIPILAHPERYSYWFNKFDQYIKLRDIGVLLQVNINSFADEYGVPTRKIAEKLVKNNMVDLIGSDFHRPQHFEVMQKALKNKYLKKLINGVSLKNTELYNFKTF